MEEMGSRKLLGQRKPQIKNALLSEIVCYDQT